MWAVFNLGRLFASSTPEYSILTQNEMIVESYWRKNVRRSMQFRERLEPTSTFCLHCFTDRFTLCLLTLFLCLRFIIKRQQKVSVFFKQKKMAVEPENQEDRLDEDSEAEGVSSTSSQQNFKSQRPQTQRVLWENSVWRGKMYTLGYSMTKKKTCHAQFVWSTKRTMHLPRERITFDLLRLNGTWLTTGRQPCEFEAAWRQLFDTLVELLHCLQFATVDLGKTKVIPRNVS